MEDVESPRDVLTSSHPPLPNTEPDTSWSIGERSPAGPLSLPEDPTLPPQGSDSTTNPTGVTPVCITVSASQFEFTKRVDEDDVIICGCCKQSFVVFTLFFEHKKTKMCEKNESQVVSVYFDGVKFMKTHVSAIKGAGPVRKKKETVKSTPTRNTQKKERKAPISLPKSKKTTRKTSAAQRSVRKAASKRVNTNQKCDSGSDNDDQLESSGGQSSGGQSSGGQSSGGQSSGGETKDSGSGAQGEDTPHDTDDYKTTPAYADVKDEPNTVSSDDEGDDADWEPKIEVGRKRKKDVENPVTWPKPKRKRKRIIYLNHQCKECGKKVKCPSDLVKHMRSHTGERPFKCPQCDKSYQSMRALKFHEISHTGKKQYLCSICGKEFMCEGYLKKHQKIVHTEERPYKCDKCAYQAKDIGCLRRHQMTHTEDKPFMCTECGQRYKHRSYLRAHMLLHTNQGEKNFKCTECDKVYGNRCTLWQHIQKIHKGNRKHGCSLCPKIFFTKRELDNHTKRHLGDKSVQCTECGMCFVEKNGLNRHMKTHTDVKPHPCPVCGQRFRARYNMRVHLEKVHAQNKTRAKPSPAVRHEARTFRVIESTMTADQNPDNETRVWQNLEKPHVDLSLQTGQHPHLRAWSGHVSQGGGMDPSPVGNTHQGVLVDHRHWNTHQSSMINVNPHTTVWSSMHDHV